MSPPAGPLFGLEVPDGFQYRADFISRADEDQLVQEIARVQFSTFEMRGVAARRRVAFFGRSYRTEASSPMPSFLLPLRDRAAALARVEPSAFAMALINEYPPGAPIGWHRDAPQYAMVAGISLLSPCRMRFRLHDGRPGHAATQERRRTASHEITLEPRSAYVMGGASREAYEHHIPAVVTLRYSITFRTLRAESAPIT